MLLGTRTFLWCGGDPTESSTPDASVTDDGGPAKQTGSAADGASPIKPSVAIDHGFSCALRANGHVYCWGLSSGLGRAPNAGPPAPEVGEVPGLTNAARIGAGDLFACVLTTDGAVVCWGNNRYGQTGQPVDMTFVSTPTPVPGLTDAVDLAVGYEHVCALRSDKSVWCWGANNTLQLGHATAGDPICLSIACNPTPTKVANLSADAIAAGLGHTCARVGSGVQCWGRNQEGQLGHPLGQAGDVEIGWNPTPTPAAATGAAVLVAGSTSTCILDASGKASCWGDDRNGQFGDLGAASRSSEPVAIAGLATPVSQLAPGRERTCAVSNGAVYCWGLTNNDTFGVNAGADMVGPTLIPFPNGVSIAFVAASHGSGHHCAVGDDGSVYCWGLNDSGETGQPNATDSDCTHLKCTPSPKKVSLP
jgi:alpha-tubulin suppressor-like RCC1 family protein